MEQVRQDGIRDVKRDAAKKHRHHGHPFKVFNECPEKRFLAAAITDNGQGNRAGGVEDDDQGEEDVPRGEVARGQVVAEPTDDKVIKGGEEECGSEGVVGAHVG